VAGGPQRDRPWRGLAVTTEDARIKLKHLYPVVQR
jgi:hypothetical protein